MSPNTWDSVRRAAPKLKGVGHPLGIGQSAELDSNMALCSFLMCFGSFVQNAHHQVTIKNKHTVEALKFMADIYQRGETDEIFGWDPSGNNNFLYSGKGSMIFNAISATRTPEDRGLPFANDLWIWPIPKGPHGRLGYQHVMGCWWVWKFAANKAGAKKFLADLEIHYKDAFLASKFYNFPSFPGAFSFKQIRKAVAQDKHRPLGKYGVLTTIAQRYTDEPWTSRLRQRGIRRDVQQVHDPADVRSGLAEEDDRAGGVNAADREIRGIYTKVAQARKNLS
jgi:multiple sugar transport system substrate-binding protein